MIKQLGILDNHPIRPLAGSNTFHLYGLTDGDLFWQTSEKEIKLTTIPLWQRNGTTLSPLTAGDNIQIDGSIIFDSQTIAGLAVGVGGNTVLPTQGYVDEAVSAIPLSSYQLLSEKNSADGYAGLDASGLINVSQLPPISITDTFVVADEAEMLALTAETGDVAIRTDLSQNFILRGTDPSVLADWQVLYSSPSYWQRTSTTLSPLNAGDSVAVDNLYVDGSIRHLDDINTRIKFQNEFIALEANGKQLFSIDGLNAPDYIINLNPGAESTDVQIMKSTTGTAFLYDSSEDQFTLNGDFELENGDMVLGQRLQIFTNYSNQMEVRNTSSGGMGTLLFENNIGIGRALKILHAGSNYTGTGFTNDLDGAAITEPDATCIVNVYTAPLYLGCDNRASMVIYDGKTGIGRYNLAVKPSAGFETRGISSVFNAGLEDLDFTINGTSGAVLNFDAGNDSFTVNKDVSFTYNTIQIAESIRHIGDTNTRLKFQGDYVGLEADGKELFTARAITSNLDWIVEVNPHAVNTDFVVYKQTSGEAYRYNAEDDKHNILSQAVLGTGAAASYNPVVINNGTTDGLALRYYNNVLGLGAAFIGFGVNNPEDTYSCLVSESTSRAAYLLAISNSLTHSEDPEILISRGSSLESSSNYRSHNIGLANQSNNFDGVFRLQYGFNTSRYLLVSRESDSSAIADDIIFNPDNRSTSFTLNKLSSGTAFRYDAGLDVTHMGNANGPDYTQIEADGFISSKGDARAYIDFNYDPKTLGSTGGNNPDRISLNGSSIEICAFSPTTLEECDFCFEYNHQAAENVDVSMHVHWMPTNTNTGDVVWKIDYIITRAGVATPAQQTITITDTAGGVAWVPQVATFPDIGAGSLNIGDQLHIRFYRDGGNAADTYNADAAVETIGGHARVDGLGSRQISTK